MKFVFVVQRSVSFCKLAGACEIFHFINQNFRYEFASHTQECSVQLYSD